jgi:hypothetical protein
MKNVFQEGLNHAYGRMEGFPAPLVASGVHIAVERKQPRKSFTQQKWKRGARVQKIDASMTRGASAAWERSIHFVHIHGAHLHQCLQRIACNARDMINNMYQLIVTLGTVRHWLQACPNMPCM